MKVWNIDRKKNKSQYKTLLEQLKVKEMKEKTFWEVKDSYGDHLILFRLEDKVYFIFDVNDKDEKIRDKFKFIRGIKKLKLK
jgi:hypothetical protein